MLGKQHLECWFNAKVLGDCARKLRTKALRKEMMRLYQSMAWVHHTFVLMPPMFVGVAGHMQGLFLEATHTLTNGQLEGPEEDLVFRDARLALLKQLMGKDRLGDPQNEKFWENACNLWQLVVGLHHQKIAKGMLASLREAIIVNGWTSIEMFLEAAWHVAITHSQARSKMGNDTRIVHLNNTIRGMPLVRKARSSVGNEKFRALQMTREAYARAFHQDSSSVDAALASVDLDALNLIRNLIVHQSGKVDTTFRTAAKFTGPIKKHGRKSVKKLAIDGAETSSLITAALSSTMELAKAVDAWIQAHP